MIRSREANLDLAQERLRRASAEKSRSLDLSDLSLVTLPEGIGCLPDVISLTLYNNKLTGDLEEVGKLTNLRILDLSANEIKQLPRSIGNLVQLTQLDAWGNDLEELPDTIGQLTQLSDLDVSMNKLRELPQTVGQLQQLISLDLSKNRLSDLPLVLGRLKKLQQLTLWGNALTKLPECVILLSGLKGLDLDGNELTELPPTISRLSKLTSLEANDNNLTDLPSTMTKLTKLNRLHLSKNKLTAFPAQINALVNLQDLHLDHNPLRSLPEGLGQLTQLRTLDLSNTELTELPSSLSRLTNLETFYIHSNELLNLPDEILGPNLSEVTSGQTQPARPADILEYYFRTRRGRRALNEAKLVLVGFGGVGKTSLVKRLLTNRFDPQELKTEGINISTWPIRLYDTESVRLHVWDFGGQEIMHATHQFFLTQRSLYLLVLTGRQGREDADAEYWLNLISSFAADSPVIIVLNKIKEHNFDVNRRALQQKFPQIRCVVETDCEDRTGLDELAGHIQKETDGLPDLRREFPAAWFAIKDRLSEMKENYLTFDSYRVLCAENGETEAEAQEALAGFLHSLGVALNYKDDPRLRDTHVLNPRWVTEGVYSILNHDKLAEQKGELCCGDLATILDATQYPLERHDFLLQLMRKFELCFRFPDEDDRYLVPELLSKEQPIEADKFDSSICLNFEYQYPTLLPEGLLPRFIVRTYVLSTEEPRWRSGVILSLEENRALIVGDPIERRVRIMIAGPLPGRRRLLAVIRSDFERIHASYKFQPTEMIPVPFHPEVLIPYRELLIFEKSGISSTPRVAGDKLFQIRVKELLDGIDLEPTRSTLDLTRREDRMRRAFVSYSHKDETLRAELETHLKLLNRQGLLDLWTDRRIIPGSEWGQQIDSNLDRADIILLLVSSDLALLNFEWVKFARRGGRFGPTARG